MTDPFRAAAAALFAAPGSIAAAYLPDRGPAVSIRVIPLSRDALVGETVQATYVYEMPGDLARPRDGETLSIGGEVIAGEIVGGEVLRLVGDGIGDVESTRWLVGAEPDD